MTRKIAVFDFDDTLVAGDSLWPFLAKIVGYPRLAVAMSMAFLADKKPLPNGVDQRGAVKLALLHRILAGQSVDSLTDVLGAMKSWPRWHTQILDRLREHKADGYHIVIASGGLDLYLPVLLQGIPYDALICTNMAIENGRLTGHVIGGNCVRAEKARRIAHYMATHGPFVESWGYGNAPHDLPMLALMDEKVVVSRKEARHNALRR